MNRIIKLIIKILLILLIIGGIVLLVIKFLGGVSETNVADLKITEFEDYITSRVEKEIADKSFEEANESFEDIVAEIETESSIRKTDGGNPIDAKEKERCLQRVFFEMVPIFLEYADDYYGNSYWYDESVKMIGDKSKYFINMHITEDGAAMAKKLSKAAKTSDDYFAALRVIDNAEKCYTIKAVSNHLSKVEYYTQQHPLDNNTSLMYSLNASKEKAERACADKIIEQCRNVADNFNNYISYEYFEADYNSAMKLMDDFIKKFGFEYWFSDIVGYMNNANENAKYYYEE